MGGRPDLPRIHTLPGHRAPRVPPGQPVRGGDHGWPVEDRRGAAARRPCGCWPGGDDGRADDGRAGRWSLVAAAVAMYWCWWSKPLNVQCPVVLYLSNQADEVEAEEGGTGVPPESSGHIELPDAEDRLSAYQVLVPQSDGEAGASRPTFSMPEMDKERLESQGCKDDLEGKRAQGHHRSLVRSVAQLASKGRATLSRMTTLIHKAQSISKWPSPVPRLAPVTPRAPGRLHRRLHRRLARRSHHRVRHDRAQPLRIRRPSHQLLYSMLDAAHSSVLTAFYVSDSNSNPGAGAGAGGGGGGGQSVIAVFVLGFVFGAIHCAAWTYPFPSSVERTIWCVAVCAITAPFGPSSP